MTIFRDRPELLKRFREGERSALEEVYWAHVARIERLARHGFYLVGKGQRVDGVRPEELRDLVQEIFTRAFGAPARLGYDGLRDFTPYLNTIARNLLVDWARRRGRELPLEEWMDDPPALPMEEEPSSADPAAVRALEAYLAELPTDLRAVYEQRYVQSLSQRDAAQALGISRQQLRTQETRLRKGLLKALKRAGIAP